MGRAVVIYNPIAGSGVGMRVAAEAESLLASRSWQARSIATRDRSGAREITRQLIGDVDLVVAVGGDGTLREVLDGLGPEREKIDVAFLPIGNANVAARELGIPLDPHQALRCLSEGAPREIDLCTARYGKECELMLAVAGLGWDARTVRTLDRIRYSRLGAAWYRSWADSAYLVAGLAAAVELDPPRFRLSVDGFELPERYCGATLCNFRCYAKGMAVTPDAHHRSGRVHYEARKASHLPALALHFAAAALQRRAPSWISDYGQARELRVEAERPVALQIDGDYRDHVTELRVEVHPAAARILAPPLRELA